MLAMHYAIDLPDAEAIGRVRTRAAERGPLFDGLAGLHQKLFLIDPERPCYATFYLWHDPDAALAFLEGEFFATLSQTFGRPKVRLLLTRTTDLPFAPGAHLALNQQRDESAALVSARDPTTGDLVTLADDGAAGRRFEVMYRAVGAEA